MKQLVQNLLSHCKQLETWIKDKRQLFSCIVTNDMGRLISERNKTNKMSLIIAPASYLVAILRLQHREGKRKQSTVDSLRWGARDAIFGRGGSWNLWTKYQRGGSYTEKEFPKSAQGLQSLWPNTNLLHRLKFHKTGVKELSPKAVNWANSQST